MMQGFVLSRHQQDRPNGIELRYWLLNSSGCHLVSIKEQEAVLFIASDDLIVVQSQLQGIHGWRVKPLELTTIEHQPVSAIYSRSLATQRTIIDRLTQASIAMMEEDIRPVDRYLMERFIFGSAVHTSEQRLASTKISPPQFKILSIDIETTMDASRIHSIGLYGINQHNHDLALVLLRGEGIDTEQVRFVPNETALLQALEQVVSAYDPDLFIGWNVIGFDFKVLAARAKALKVKLRLGRDDQPLKVIQSESGKHYVRIEGRLVLDGIDTLKGATYQFENYSLEFVAQSLFGEGKLIHNPNDRGAEIQRLYREEPLALARYNLQDCKLVWDIFNTTGLVDYLVERTRLTGLQMDKVGGSAAAFDFCYLPRMHRAGYVAPQYASGARGLDAPGGYVMESLPGLYRHVLVLDFKSLYPSIIRTFKIDPVGMAEGLKQSVDTSDLVPGFNGAIFSQSRSILPALIADLWEARDKAKQQYNTALSQAIKIIMNSFYGVLGSNVCRFFDQRLSGSITLRGHQILQETRDEIEAHFGYSVIYGDTDSVFVLLGDQYTNQQADGIGHKLAAHLNAWWKARVEQRFATESYLELEYETHFSHFLMPRMRHSEKGSKKRYAGLQRCADGAEKLIFKGLENVRSDWTPLARRVQQTLYEAVFRDQPYQSYLVELVTELRKGKLDQELVYRRRIRQPLEAYQRIKPPHVQAALKAEQYWSKRGQASPYRPGQAVSYVMTVKGAEPVEARRSVIDYEHYIEKQLQPVVDAILVFKDQTFADIINTQTDLFK